MKNSKKVIAACSLAIGIGAGSIIFTPSGIHAANNVVLASVDWVNAKINPINSKLTSLETRINTLESTVSAQQKVIDNLKSGDGSVSTKPTTVYVNKSSANIYSGATRSYRVVAAKGKGNSLSVIDTFNSSSGLWYRVSITSTLKGWIYSGDVSTSKVSSSSASSVVTFGEVNLRKGASTNYSSIQLIPRGTSLKYIQSFTNSLGETWYNVETSTGKRGWMISSLGEVK